MPEPQKKPLVLIPGLVCTHELWTKQINVLTDVAEISVANHSLNEDIVALARTILNRIEAPKFALAGLSMGGYIAHEIMRQAPERVERLALIATSAHPETKEMAKKRKGFISIARMGRFRGMSLPLLRSFLHKNSLEDSEIVDLIYKMAAETGAAKFVRQSMAILSRPDSRPFLPKYKCPTLILCGDSDERAPMELHEYMADHIPNNEFVVLKECGHLPTLERPTETGFYMRKWLLDMK
jgi:pimeloyl-ACP methyl ester carboxylesterase